LQCHGWQYTPRAPATSIGTTFRPRSLRAGRFGVPIVVGDVQTVESMHAHPVSFHGLLNG